jgi:hypothetical protein
VVDDRVDLLGELLVDGGDERLDRLDRVVGDGAVVASACCGEGLDRGLDRLLGAAWSWA